MVGTLHRLLRPLGRFLTVLLLVAGMGLLGPASAAQIFCPQECEMHQPVQPVPSCCESPAMVPETIGTAGHGPQSNPATQACCEGDLCIDASSSAADFIAALTGIERDFLNSPILHYQAESTLSGPTAKLFLEQDVKGPPIPVYLRTCVFLI